MFHFDVLEQSLNGINVRVDPKLFGELDDRYGDESRHYHDRSHVTECLRQLVRLARLAHRTHEIAVAIWFHDAIYDTHRDDNEEKSAEWASTYLGRNGADTDTIRRIENLILATKSHVTNGGDESLFVDIDLGILGTPKSTFESYDASIRKEYSWVPEDQYRTGRRQVLENFLLRDRIYQTQTLWQQYESAARENLNRKILELST